MGSPVHLNDGVDPLSPANSTFNFKRKTPLQLQTLENLYSDDRYPTQRILENYACALGLSYKQVRGWFIERRKKDEKDIAGTVKACRMKKKKMNEFNLVQSNGGLERPVLLEDMLYSTDYILENLFRKTGPPLGVEFDAIPSALGEHHRDDQDDQEGSWAEGTEPATSDCQPQGEICALVKKHGMGKGLMRLWRVMNPEPAYSTTFKRRKILYDSSCSPAKKHGIGKGLMSVWKVLHPNAGKFCAPRLSSDRGASGVPNLTSSRPKKPIQHKRLRKKLVSQTSRSSIQQKKNPHAQRRKLECNAKKNLVKAGREECRLSIDATRCKKHLTEFATLVDDEEIELREQQLGPDPPICSAHFASNEKYACPLCKDLLAKFPPDFVRKKQPLLLQPWSSSGNLVKKLFKVFQFLYTYAVITAICPFTLDEFAQAFVDKDSMLLGRIHVSLLEIILSDVEKEFSSGLFPRTKNCMFHNLLQLVEDGKFDVSFWKKSINPLTWIEILREVLIAAGFGSKGGTLIRKGIEKNFIPHC